MPSATRHYESTPTPSGRLGLCESAYSYDEVNSDSRVRRQTTIVYEDGTRVTNTYDPVSERLTMQDSSNSQSSPGATTFTYDETRRLKTVTYPANKTITYSFDEVGNRTLMVDPDSGRTTYSYDAVNNLTSLLNPFSERTTFPVTPSPRLPLAEADLPPNIRH